VVDAVVVVVVEVVDPGLECGIVDMIGVRLQVGVGQFVVAVEVLL
jgi:hypothetical protein